jgi:hypothetical protein
MVFHLFLKLHELRYDVYPRSQVPSVSEPYSESNRDHLTVGIGCGPSGNNCSVEGIGNRGPGLMPLPGHLRAQFVGGRHLVRGSRGSLFDLTGARKSLGASGDENSSGALHTHALGFGSSAYSVAHPPSLPLSGVHIPLASASSGNLNDAHHSSFFGRLTKPKPTTDISEVWGRRSYSDTSQSSSAAQFTSVASMVPQSSNSSFHMRYIRGVVDPTSVEVRGGNSISSSVGPGRWSWNSARLMDKDYNLLVKPTHVDVSRIWSKRVIDGQFSTASMLPQSSNSSFHFRTRHGVVDMSSVYASGDVISARRHGTHFLNTAAAGQSHYNDGFYAALGSNFTGGGGSAGFGGSYSRSGYSWSTDRNKGLDSNGMGDWLIAPEAAQWLPEGIGTSI